MVDAAVRGSEVLLVAPYNVILIQLRRIGLLYFQGHRSLGLNSSRRRSWRLLTTASDRYYRRDHNNRDRWLNALPRRGGNEQVREAAPARAHVTCTSDWPLVRFPRAGVTLLTKLAIYYPKVFILSYRAVRVMDRFTCITEAAALSHERNEEIPYSTFFSNNPEQAPVTQLKYVPATSAAKHSKVPEQRSMMHKPQVRPYDLCNENIAVYKTPQGAQTNRRKKHSAMIVG
ncbi:hypothetical protein EVAR_24844_1 [Eumeta japonica]|uniref:Uncharacterized protein n=1 Tax=Eumeta variegata TaxID=151549 RepID=A0A4C1Y8K4_EUMVA|nr:hypothetical protein EVAR_24844_1 [Eumeta japonica]